MQKNAGKDTSLAAIIRNLTAGNVGGSTPGSPNPDSKVATPNPEPTGVGKNTLE